MKYNTIIFGYKDEKWSVRYPLDELDNILDAIQTLQYGQPIFSKEDERW